MRRNIVSLAALFFAAVTFVPSATAANPHFKNGGEPVCTISDPDQTVSCTGSLAGLGNQNLTVDLTVSGEATFQCQNKGGNIAPGRNKVPFTSSTSTMFGKDEIKNGSLTFTVSVVPTAGQVSGKEAGCPNGNWKAVNGTFTLTGISLVISQPPGTTIFTCTASDPTSPVTLTCV